MDSLIADFVSPNEVNQSESFSSILRVAREAGISANGVFPNDLFILVTDSIFISDLPRDVAFVTDTLIKKAMIRFVDVRFYMFRNLKNIIGRSSSVVVSRIFDLLVSVPCPNASELKNLPTLIPISDSSSSQPLDASQDSQFHKIQHMRGEFSSMWHNLVDRLDPSKYERLLAILDKNILPNIFEPELFVGFLTSAYRAGGMVGILALDALFTLIRSYNVEVPDFYDHLYALLSHDVLVAPYRVIFFKAVARFMSSTMVPAYVVAAVVKRMSRLLLGAPPSAIVWAVPFIYNMLKRYPAVRVLVHRELPGGLSMNVSTDPYNPFELKTMNSRAIESSLWELAALEDHYWVRISRLPAIFHDRFVKPEFDLDDIAESIDQVDTASAAKEELDHLWSRRPPVLLTIPSAAFF
jgi:hypothetical protein